MAKGKGFIHEFQTFIMRGNVMDMAVGVIIGGAFQKIISSLVDDIIMPLISRITGGIDFTNWFLALDGSHYKTLSAAKDAGAATLNYGAFLTVIINFLLMALVIFILLKTMNNISAKMARKAAEAPVITTQTCPFCKTEIALDATRCPNCTSILEEVPADPEPAIETL